MIICEQCGIETTVGVCKDVATPTKQKEGDWGYWLSQPFKLCKPCFDKKANVVNDHENYILMESGE